MLWRHRGQDERWREQIVIRIVARVRVCKDRKYASVCAPSSSQDSDLVVHGKRKGRGFWNKLVEEFEGP
jgi:hypothetical protein